MRRRRVSGGGIAAWSEALSFLRSHLRALLSAVAVLLAAIIIANIFPGTPPWSSGFITGFLVATMFGFAWWLAWVPSGMASRGMGLVAEEWTSDLLRNSPGVWAVIPSLKFHGKDVDHVVIAASGVVAVETKWTAVKSPDLERAAHQAADAGRTLRLSLRREDLPQSLFTSVVLFWGPSGGQIPPQTINTSLGPVRVMSGAAADPWLETLRAGPLGEDYAGDLRREVEATAIQRDQDAIKAGRVLRWLAKAR